MRTVFFCALFFLHSISSIAKGKVDPSVEKLIYEFICTIDRANKSSDCESIDDIISNYGFAIIREIKVPKIENIQVYFFKSAASHSQSYLLIKQDDRVLVIGQRKKDIFEEMKEVYDFIECSDMQKIDFMNAISKDMYFVFGNNLSLKNSRRIKVNGEYIN